ncbi:hypothetical protein [Pseudomonas sp. EggHat1]|uniref:hypothetical protein n=1 Tax=Pseudomonas sp. EggHat1 TaxID=2761624 RepID=UPI00186624A6|nr:hypothetical protein [Pseudomonas sp. EggHat1]
MRSDVREAAAGQPVDQGVQPLQEWVTPEERLLLRFYRQLDQGEQAFMRRAIEALATRDSPR